MLEGTQTAEAAAKNIQARVSIYLEELLYGEQNGSASEKDAAEYILTSSQTDAVLSVSYEHIEDFEIDTPYPVSVEEFAGKIITFGFETAIYSYYDRTQRTHGYDGLVWQITTQPISDLEQFYELDQDELCYMINVRLLGYDEKYIYKLVCLGMLFKEDHQYDSENITSIQSYCEHMEYGITVLEDFIERNELQTFDNAIDWKEWYTREIMAPVKAYME